MVVPVGYGSRNVQSNIAMSGLYTVRCSYSMYIVKSSVILMTSPRPLGNVASSDGKCF